MNINLFYKMIIDMDNKTDYIIYDYIKSNKINYIKNNNGIFFNLNNLNKEQINELYLIINDYTNNIKSYNDKVDKMKHIINKSKKNSSIIEKKQIYKKININKFTKKEIDIINFSKKI
uniref:NET domain-containing protein n=1 Tax=viral metagenome TaxID=1070528 RepID=A0A6C0CY01_9ZZZZ